MLSLLASLGWGHAEGVPDTRGTHSVITRQLADSDGDGVTDDKDLCPNTPGGTTVNAYGCALESSQCDYTSSTVTLNSSGGSSGSGVTTQYVLASNHGMILQISNSPSFTGLSGTASYMALALTYQGSISNLSVGQSLSTVSGDCYDWSDALVFKDCVPSTTCDYTTSTITLQSSGGSTGAGITTRYLLVSMNDMILQVSNTPSFTGLTGSANYKVVAVTYQGVINNLSMGQLLSAVGGDCYTFSGPVVIRVCVTPENCDYTTSTVTLKSSGGSTGAGITTQYVLTDTNDKILQISSTSSFTGLSGSANYKAVAITYQGSVSNLSVGQSLSLVNGSCYELSTPVYFRACVPPIPPTTCDYQIGQVISLSALGGSTGTGVTTKYVLTNAAGILVQVSDSPSFTTASLAAGTYTAYSVVYSGSVSNLVANGTNTLSSITGDCVAKSTGLPLLLCANCPPAVCVPIVVKVVKR